MNQSVSFLCSRLLGLALLLGSFSGEAANIQVDKKAVMMGSELVFDLSWDASWNMNAPFNNRDAAWLFAKYKDAAGLWQPITFAATGHSKGNTPLAMAFAPGSSEGKVVGLFFYRSTPGVGRVETQGLRLRTIGVPAAAEVDVFAVEMVYIPQGAFWLGSGGADRHGFRRADSLRPFRMTAENATYLLSNANVALPNALSIAPTNWPANVANTYLPEAFPKGVKAFYSMKYEISQAAYCDFLNSLTPTQQQARSGLAITDANVNKYIQAVAGRNSYRQGIMLVKVDGEFAFYCNYADDMIYDKEFLGRPGDGQNTAMNYLSLEDMLAFLDWSGLRPLTELEYEKMGRGPLRPVADEYAWGSALSVTCSNPLTMASALGSGLERPDLGNYNGSGIPMRVGCFAHDKSTRLTAGAGFYGCMDLTGNVSERYICLSDFAAHSFEGLHGDGLLDDAGLATTQHNWPTAAVQYIWRGGVNNSYLGLSDRNYHTSTSIARLSYAGMRGGRTEE